MGTIGTSGNPARSHRSFGVMRALAAAVACAALCGGTIGAAQTDRTLSFRRLTTRDGMPNAEVQCVFQDSRGFLWFGTSDGLVRNDGHEMRVFRPELDAAHSLGGLRVNDLKEDAQGKIWVATGDGLDVWDRVTEQFTHRRNDPANPASLSHNDCFCLLVDAEGAVWVGTRAGLNRFDPRSGRWDRFVPELAVRCLVRDRTGILWLGTRDRGLHRFDPGSGQVQAFTHDPGNPESLSDQRVRSLAEDAEGGLWIGTDSGLCRLDPQRRAFKRFGYDAGVLVSRVVYAVVVDREGMVWAGTDGGGVSRLDPVSGRFVHHRHSRYDTDTLVSDKVRTLFEDRHGDLWVGHYPAGISHLNRLAARFQVVHAIPGDANALSDDHIQALWEDPSGDLWVGTDGGGLNHWEAATGQWKAYKHDPRDGGSLGDSSVLSLIRDRQGVLWVGTRNGGLNRFEPDSGTFRRYTPDAARANALSGSRVGQLLEDRQGQLWVMPNSAGIDRYVPEDDGFVHHRRVAGDPHSLHNNFVWSLMEDRAGQLWAGTSRGLTRRDPATGRWRQWPITNDPGKRFSTSPVLDMVETQEGAIWACTEGGGLWRLDPKTEQMHGLHVADGLPSEVTYSILEDEDGILWMSSNNGLARIDPHTRQIRTFDEYGGLPSRFFSRRARLRLRSGELLFGTVQGLVRFQPRTILPNLEPPPVVFTSMDVFNQQVALGTPGSLLQQSLTETQRLEIPARLSMLTFRFAVLNYRSPQLNRCLYRLEGFDAEWRDPGTDFRALYTNLDPGRYTLRVKAANNDAVWNETGASLELIIVPQWWRTWWFRGAMVALFLGAAAGGGAVVSTRRARARIVEMERESQLARERELAQAEREHARAEREKLQGQLAQAQKMESIGRLAGGVAHDFNNMLQAILGNAAIALEEAPDTPALREPLDEINKAARRSADLTRQLLAFARQQPVRPVALDLNETVAGMLKMLQRLVDANIRLTFTPGAGLWTVKIDPSQVDQILANLVVNAHHAIIGQGAITIVTANLSIDALYAETHAEAAPGDYVVLSVSDTGSGMDAETRSHLFEPFFTTKAVGKGTGLGLATVYGIVRQNQGFINVYSEPGQGAMFRIHLPRCTEAAAPSAPGPQAPPSQGRETILLVEDELQILAVCQRTLERLGYRVLAAGDPSVAATVAAAHPGQIHLLLTDVIMPAMNGHELLQALRRSTPGLRCVFMSGYTSDTFTRQGVIPEGVHFLSKPFTAESLAATIRAALDQPA